MRKRTVFLLGAAALLAAPVAASAVTGMALCTTQSEVQLGGEVGNYFFCTCIGAQRAFRVNYSFAPESSEGTFFEPRVDCPLFAHVSKDRGDWRD